MTAPTPVLDPSDRPDRSDRGGPRRGTGLFVGAVILLVVALGSAGAALVVRHDTGTLQARAEPVHDEVRELAATEAGRRTTTRGGSATERARDQRRRSPRCSPPNRRRSTPATTPSTSPTRRSTSTTTRRPPTSSPRSRARAMPPSRTWRRRRLRCAPRPRRRSVPSPACRERLVADQRGSIRATRRRRALAFGGALVLALAGLAFLGWSISQHQDARDELRRRRGTARRQPGDTSSDADVAAARARRRSRASASSSQHSTRARSGLADLDQHDLDAVRAAVQAGLAGALADYNAAVDQRAALDPAARRRGRAVAPAGQRGDHRTRPRQSEQAGHAGRFELLLVAQPVDQRRAARRA